MNFRTYHKELESLHINCEKPRAYYIPYASEESAKNNDRFTSEYYSDLNGEWNFRFYNTFEDIDDNFLDIEFADSIPIPCCWQTQIGKGYDVPLYSNLWYPFPIDPPFVPVENPCGHYNREFSINKISDKKYYINFEGVSSCFYLFINKQFAGYSQVSHCTSEINITDFITDGKNRIDVLVVKWCDGSYLEDQDMFRLSGIFRDVYILERNSIDIKDIYIRQNISDDLSLAKINIECDSVPEYSLYDDDGKLLRSGKGNDFEIVNPSLWNAENPATYTLILKFESEYIPFILALKKLEFRGNVAYFNNKPIKLLGINRHDSNPETGYYLTDKQMLDDLFILKRANVNTIRTSHYPNSPVFLDLCKKYGFMVVDEADIETHGMGFEYKDTWDWYRWSKLSTDDEWEESYVDRAARLFERDKNHGNVIMWSLGNESGCGKNHRAMRKYIKSRDSKAIVHYENSHLEFKAVPVGENFSDISDVESRMYAPIDYTEKYAQNKNSKKPFYYCEYSCSMSTGDIKAQVDLMRKYPSIFGGCFWELTDHAVKIGEGKYRYGGDFGDFPNNSICCIDGVIFPDRTPRPGYYNLKKAYEPFECKFENDILTVFNRRYFETLDDYYIRAELEKDGEIIDSFDIDIDSIAPQSEKQFRIDIDIPCSDCLYFTFYLCGKNGSDWAEKDYEYGFCQFDLSSKSENKYEHNCSAPEYCETSRYIDIVCPDKKFRFDKSYGCILSAVSNNTEFFSEPLKIEIYKAPGYNEEGKANDWKSAAMQCVISNVRSSSLNVKDNCIEITCETAIGGPAVVPVLSGNLIYRFYGDGVIDVIFDGETRPLLSDMNLRLPRFGFCATLPESFELMEYFGKGPYESYSDNHWSARFGKFNSSVTENFVPYVKPTECGAHFAAKYGKLSDGKGNIIEFRPITRNGFIFNANNFKPGYLEKVGHNDELVPDDKTYVYLDYQIDVRGGRGLYEEIEPERKFELGKILFGISIKIN